MGKTTTPTVNEEFIVQSIEDVMHQSMMPYAEYVILDRAIPRVEDGLKPVQRRILYTMLELGLTPDKPYRKSARIVGDCLGKYHPHGDTSVYDAMVRMAQDFNMQAQLVDGHGNFGSIDGDPAAAMRYTEARMKPLAMELLRDINKDTVSYSFNFDDTMKEPDMLPGRYPNLLVNGATGIAVGLATNIPPHNLVETIDATIALMFNRDLPLEKLMKHIHGPDFPTGGYLLDTQELVRAYETGKGRVAIRAKTHFEPLKNGKTLLVIDELPFQVNKASALEKILRLSEDKKQIFAPISDIRDESDRNGMRAVIELKKETDCEKILQYLYKYSDLQINFNFNMVAIAKGKPELLGLRQILGYYIDYQKQVITRRTQYDLDAALKRAHILEGLIIAIDAIDAVIKLIRASSSIAQAKSGLMERFDLSEVQAQAVLDMRLQRLTNLSIIELKKEHAELLALIAQLQAILADEHQLLTVIKKELTEIKKAHGKPRQTQLLDQTPIIQIDESEYIQVEEVVVFMTASGIKRMNTKTYDSKGCQEESRVLWEIRTATNKRVALFTNLGTMYSVDVCDIPEPKGKDKGVIPSGLLQGWQDGEEIIAVYCLEDETDEQASLLFYSKKGLVKRSLLSQYQTRNKRIVSYALKDGDELLDIERVKGEDSILFLTKQGMSIRFSLDTVPVTGRATSGVKAMQLEPADEIIFAQQVNDEGSLFVISDRGYGKRSLLCDYELQGRNGKGLKTFDFKKNKSNGEELVQAIWVTQPMTLHVVQRHGDETILESEGIRLDGRFSKGFPLIMVLMDNFVSDVYAECLPSVENDSE